jgi:hypothetical protein
VIEYEKMLEELSEAATIYIARYMNTTTHAGTDYNILRAYEAWCFKTRARIVPGGFIIPYSINTEEIKSKFITELLRAGEQSPVHNKNELSIVNLRRHAQPALDHLAAFQVRAGLRPRAPPLLAQSSLRDSLR